MEYSNLKTLESESAAEPTALTMRAIKDILAETGDDDLLMSSGDAQSKTPVETPQQAQARLNEIAAQTQHCETSQPSQQSFAKRLTNKLFG